MLKGIRKRVISDFKKEKERALTENIQYDSLQKFNDKKFLQKKIQRTKNKSFLKNRYKYKDMKSKQLGKFKEGVLNLSKKNLYTIKHSK